MRPLPSASHNLVVQYPELLKIADPLNITQRTAYPYTRMSDAVVSSYDIYTKLARAAYCGAKVSSWTCGAACMAVPNMTVYATGGDDMDTPDWYVGYVPMLESAVVAHQGTTLTALKSILVDLSLGLVPLNSALFPGVQNSVRVHRGFAEAHSRSAKAIQSAVEKIMSDHRVTKVATIGHSLGGAIALLDAVYLKLVLPKLTTIKVVTYGQPRVGNAAFANYVDQSTKCTHAVSEGTPNVKDVTVDRA
ncbi:hypothetical protein FRB97_003189 [Tulasnella sp. 331]|nr:hypothetical protein FRB97_003189 [Tulasnella sp. 331]